MEASDMSEDAGRGPGGGKAPRVEDITAEAAGNPSFDGHEAVFRVADEACGLEAIIALHDSTLGPALGGTRVWSYADRDAALTDVLRLSRGMTMKGAMARTATGGGKAVVLADPRSGKTEALLRGYGRAVESLGGRFVTGEDVGLSVEDADVIAGETRFVLGARDRGGDPSPATALGVHEGIKSAVRRRLGAESLSGLRILVQGLGHVGARLAERLARDGAALTVTDIDEDRIREAARLHGAETVRPRDLLEVEADVFAPCAMGGVIADEAAAGLKAAVVAGSANNQLLEPRHGAMLHERGVLYAPDYVINGGGLIALSLELSGEGYSWERALGPVSGIGATLDEVFETAAREKLPPEQVTDGIALRRIAEARAA